MPRKTLQERKINRIAPLVKNLLGVETADDIMIELMNILTENRTPPVAGKYYIFVYNAKTQSLRYDQNPFVYVKKVYNWGFSGLNYHWGQERQYTWEEIAGGIRGMYEVYQAEIEDLKRLPFGNIRTK
jgi:hypothetical protein